MKNISLILAVCAFCTLLAVSVPVKAQQHPKTVGEMILVVPKPGSGAQWEEALKRRDAWQRQHNIPFTWYVWQIISGPQTGDYDIGTFGHDWADFDTMEAHAKENNANLNATVAPYTELHTTSYFAYEPDLSNEPPAAARGVAPPAPFAEADAITLKPGGSRAFVAALKDVLAAVKKENYPFHYSVYELLDGGPPTIYIVQDHKNWADFQPPKQRFSKMIQDVYGKIGDSALYRAYFRSIQSEDQEIVKYRPGLSYIPEGRQ